jgi:hypothetical protein
MRIICACSWFLSFPTHPSLLGRDALIVTKAATFTAEFYFFNVVLIYLRYTTFYCSLCLLHNFLKLDSSTFSCNICIFLRSSAFITAETSTFNCQCLYYFFAILFCMFEIIYFSMSRRCSIQRCHTAVLDKFPVEFFYKYIFKLLANFIFHIDGQ